MNTKSIDLELDSSQYLSITDAAQVGLDLSGDLTLECWIKLESLPSGEYGVICKSLSTGNQRGYNFFIVAGVSNPKFGIYISSDGGNVNRDTIISGEYAFSTGVWYHVAVTYKASTSEYKFYINGSQFGSTQYGSQTSIYNNTTAFTIGADQGGISDYFDGKIDEVRVWNVVRTQTEINDNKAVQIDSATGLVGSWHFDDALTDSSGNGNTLTNNNSATFSTDIPFPLSAIKKVAGVAYASIKKIAGVPIASVKKVAGVA